MAGTLIVIGGPTAVGKTSLSLELAEWMKAEIMSSDSRQCYRQLTIGTAKPSEEELQRVPHHFINSHDITQLFTAGDFSREARSVSNSLFSKHDFIIVAGGSGLYLNAFLHGISDIPNIDPAVRDKLNSRLANEGLEPLQSELLQHDPQYARTADLMNPQRVIRALEVFYGTGKTLSSFHEESRSGELPYKVVGIGLDDERELLYRRIDERVMDMVDRGLFEEAEGLYEFRDHYALKTVGYKEVFDFMEGRMTRDEAIASIQQNSRRYAKRQLTWFRKYGEMQWFNPGQRSEIKSYVTQVTGFN